MIQEVGANQAAGSNVPPPPTEVKVRTLHSDVEGLAKMGGGLPQFRTVSVEGSPSPKNRVEGGTVSGNGPVRTFPWWIVAVAAVVLGLIVWFGYVVVLKK